jgi:protein disulfide-isomerase A6
MMDFAFTQAKSVAEARLSGRAGSSSSSSSGSGSQGNKAGSDKDVVILTDANFDELVMHSNDLWLVEFYAPWCGHCKRLEPEWSDAATKLKGEVKVGKVDATVEQRLGSRFGIRGYPTIKMFPTGPKSDSNAEDYEAARDAATIVSWALEKKNLYKPISKVEQITSQEDFDQVCTNQRGICLVAFLPHILDSSAEERNNYIEMFKEVITILIFPK